LIAVLFFPNAPVQRVVAVTGNQIIVAVLDFNQPVLRVIGIAGGLAGFGLLGQVAGFIVLVKSDVDTRTALDQAVVGIIGPCPLNPAVGNSVVILIPVTTQVSKSRAHRSWRMRLFIEGRRTG